MDLKDILEDVKKSFKNERLASKIGTGSTLKTLTEKDFIIMPPFWQDSIGTLGIPFGRCLLFAGSQDSGKSSMAIQAMKAAIQQGCKVIYCETEGKTSESDFISWNVDPDKIAIIKSAIAEEMYELLFTVWDAIKKDDPASKLLVVIDSLGNLISKRDESLDLTQQSSSPGGHGRLNRLGINKCISRMSEDNTALFLVSYVYDNIGSVGKTNAGGMALNFFSSLIYQTSRKKWLEKTIKGQKERIGAEVVFKLYKNHINKSSSLPKEIVFHITADGIEYINKSEIDSSE